MTTPTKRARRTPAQIIADLNAKAAAIADRYDALVQKIERLEAKYADRLEVDTLRDELTRTQINLAIEDQRAHAKLLRMAIKAKGGAL